MKADMDDSNYEGMINRLIKGTIDQKSAALKRLLFLYENAKSRIYLYERRITECLELLLLIEENDLSLNALTLLQKIITSSSVESEITNIIKKRLLNKVVMNLGSVQMAIRRISHKCILQFVRKFKDYETVVSSYLKTAILQSDNLHLKLKSINSLHSLLMNQNKFFSHSINSALPLIEQLISAAYQQEHLQLRRASLLCLIFVLRIQASQKNLKAISPQSQQQLYQLTFQSEELAALLEMIMKYKIGQPLKQIENSEQESAPSPKFQTIHDQEIRNIEPKLSSPDKIPQMQLKVFNDVYNAQQFLKRLQKTSNWDISEIKEFSQYIYRYLIDDSIKLFSISKKIVEVVFDSEKGKQKQYYVVLVPCVVNGIGNKRFIIRKNLDKLVRQYMKNHTEVWVQNFIERFATIENYKVKQILMDLFTHAYKTSPEFYYPYERCFQAFDKEIIDRNSNLKWKAIDCVIIILERQGLNEKFKQQMLSIFSPDAYNKILRKLGKNPNLSIKTNRSGLSDQQITQNFSPKNLRKSNRRVQRLITDQPLLSIEKQKNQQRCDNVSEGKQHDKAIIPFRGQKKARRSQAEIDFRHRRLQLPKQRQQRVSIQKLPQLKKQKNLSHLSRFDDSGLDSPVKRAITQKSIMYTEKQNLRQLDDSKGQLQRVLFMIKDSSWNTQFESIHVLRCIIEFHEQLINDQNLSAIVNELLTCLNSLKSGVSKIAMICLCQIIRKYNKRLFQYTQGISLAVIKKSLVNSEFLQQEIRRCLTLCVEELCLAKIISSINTIKDSKPMEIKLSVILMIETMVKNQKIYKKELQWIWNILLQYHDEPQNNLRSSCKKVIKTIMETQKDWKNDVMILKKSSLDKIDKILKSFSQKGTNNTWLQSQNQEFQKILASKNMTAKFFANEYAKFQQTDRNYTAKKNWKDRMRLLSQIFNAAFQHSKQFENNINAKKYAAILCDHMDEKNPGLLLNAYTIINKSLQYFPSILDQSLGCIIQKTLTVLQTKRAEMVTVGNKFLSKLYQKFDPNKTVKQLLRISTSSVNQKIKIQAVSQIIFMMKQSTNAVNGFTVSLQNHLIKTITRLNSGQKSIFSQMNAKLKELVSLCGRKLGSQFVTKISTNERLSELLQ